MELLKGSRWRNELELDSALVAELALDENIQLKGPPPQYISRVAEGGGAPAADDASAEEAQGEEAQGEAGEEAEAEAEAEADEAEAGRGEVDQCPPGFSIACRAAAPPPPRAAAAASAAAAAYARQPHTAPCLPAVTASSSELAVDAEDADVEGALAAIISTSRPSTARSEMR